ncbi:TPA: restriction endonuclease subunit S [Vibrio parahaemolyticus]
MSELPKGWVNQNLVEITTKIGSGSTPRGGQDAYKAEGIPLIRSMNVRFSGLDAKGLAFIDNEQADKLNAVTISDKDVLLNITGASIGRVSVARDWAVGGRVNQHVCIIRPVFVDPLSDYLNYYLMTPKMQDYINSNESGATRQALTKAKVESLSVPIAPLPEQKRIVEKLDEVLAQVDTIKARLDGIPDLLKRFRQSVFASAVSGKLTEEWRSVNKTTDPLITWVIPREIERDFKLPKEWRAVKLGDVSERVSVGHVGKTSEFYTDEENGIPFLRSQNVRPGRISMDGLSYITKDAYNSLKKSQLRAGDLLVVRVGANRGDACILPDIFEKVNCANIVFARPKKGLSSYLEIYFQSPFAQALLLGKSVGGAQGVINTKSVQATYLALPPQEEQKEIVRLVDQYFAFADTIEAQVKKAQARVGNLTQSILAKAFRGELVPQNDDDEPAEVLLERIAQARKEAEALAKAAKKRAANKARV